MKETSNREGEKSKEEKDSNHERMRGNVKGDTGGNITILVFIKK